MLESVAREMLEKIGAFRKEWNIRFDSVEELDRKRFWELIDALRDEVIQFRINLHRTDGIETACRGLCRKALTGEGKWTISECVRFAKTYRVVVREIAKKYAELFDYCGDSFGDFMDALPLMDQRCWNGR